MNTLKTLTLTCAASVLLVPVTALANSSALCASKGISSRIMEPRVEMERLTETLEESAAETLDLSDTLVVRGAHPFALHWTSHALKLDGMKTHINAMAQSYCRLSTMKGMPADEGLANLRDRLAAVASATNDAIRQLQDNRLAHMNADYQRTIKDIRENARRLNSEVIGVVQIARSAQRGTQLEARTQTPVTTE